MYLSLSLFAYAYIFRDRPHNPASQDAYHIFADIHARGHDHLLQTHVNYHMLYVLHPMPRVAISAMPTTHGKHAMHGLCPEDHEHPAAKRDTLPTNTLVLK